MISATARGERFSIPDFFFDALLFAAEDGFLVPVDLLLDAALAVVFFFAAGLFAINVPPNNNSISIHSIIPRNRMRCKYKKEGLADDGSDTV